MNLETGESELIVSLAGIVKIPFGGRTPEQNWSWFNHLLINPGGTRFIFLHRWRADTGTAESRARSGFITRLFTANLDRSGCWISGKSSART